MYPKSSVSSTLSHVCYDSKLCLCVGTRSNLIEIKIRARIKSIRILQNTE